jgi:tetratricopeptide (TPR) repeat protein
VFEDLQWADAGLLDFVEELTDWWRDRPILIIAMARPELTDRRPSWGAGRQGMISLRLSPLSDSEMRALTISTVPGLPEEAVSTIVERAAGIPLYAVELLRGLLAQGDLEEEAGHYRLVGDVARMAVPESLQAVIGARLDRLDPVDRAVLQDAAVLGYAFTVAGLASIKQEGVTDLETHLEHLVKRELIEPVRDPRSSERGLYRFLQALTRDVALGRMSRETKRARHLDVARYFEGLLDPELAVVVASHYLEALNATPKGAEADELRAKALASMAAAAGRAADLRAHEQVLTIGEQALALADSTALKAPFWEQMTSAATSLARGDESDRYGRLALDHYRAVGDQSGVNRVVRILGFAYLQEQQPTAAAELLQNHLEGKPDLSSDPELAQAAALLARALLLMEHDEEAIAASDRALAAAEILDLKPAIADTLVTKGTALGHPGRLVEARILLEGAIALADRYDIVHSAMRGRNNFAHLFGTTDPPAAKRAVSEAYELAKRTGDRSMAMIPGVNLVAWYVVSLEFEQIERLLSDPILQNPPDQLQAGFLISRAQVAWLRGELDASRAMYQKAFDLVADEEDPLVAMSRDGCRAEKALVEGNLAHAFDVAIELCRQGWSGVSSGIGAAVWSLALLGDPARISQLVEVIDGYPGLLPGWSECWQLMAEATVDPVARREEVEKIVKDFEQNELYEWALCLLIAAAQFFPRGKPERQQFLSEARRRCEEKELAGLLREIDRHVA